MPADDWQDLDQWLKWRKPSHYHARYCFLTALGIHFVEPLTRGNSYEAGLRCCTVGLPVAGFMLLKRLLPAPEDHMEHNTTTG